MSNIESKGQVKAKVRNLILSSNKHFLTLVLLSSFTIVILSVYNLSHISTIRLSAPNQTIPPDVKAYLNITSDIPKSMSNEEKAALIQAIGAERSARLQASSTDRNTIIIAIATCLAAGIGIIGQLKPNSNRENRAETEQQESETIHT
jgi:hypothetical protein